MSETKSTSLKGREHVLYEDCDADAPNAIKDRNGEVVLAVCKVCRLGESQLEDTALCPGPRQPTKSEPSFTPAPWLVTRHAQFILGGNEQEFVAELLPRPERSKRKHANARLIAAAPEMFAALEQALRVAPCNADEDPELVAFYSQVRAVMAKARGGT